MNHKISYSNFRGFSLIELLAVIAILGMLALLIIPVINYATKISSQTKCINNMRTLYQGAMLYTYDNGGKLPSVTNAWHRDIWPYIQDGGTAGNHEPLGWGYVAARVTGGELQEWPYACPTDLSRHGPVGYFSYAINSNIIGETTIRVGSPETVWFLETHSGAVPGTVRVRNTGTREHINQMPEYHQGSNTLVFGDGHVQLKANKDIPDRLESPELWLGL